MSPQKSKWKNQFSKLNSSKFHETIRQIFISDDFFKNLSCYQEVKVSSLVPGYQSNQHAVDWYVEELMLIIELHGEQHYTPTNFGNSSFEQTNIAFNNIRYRDNLKKTALEDSGYTYLEIPYKDITKLNSEYLKNKIFKG